MEGQVVRELVASHKSLTHREVIGHNSGGKSVSCLCVCACMCVCVCV